MKVHIDRQVETVGGRKFATSWCGQVSEIIFEVAAPPGPATDATFDESNICKRCRKAKDATVRKAGYMGNVNPVGCDPDVP